MKKTIVRFTLWVYCIPKRKRKHSNVKVGVSQFDKEMFDENKEALTKSVVDGCSETIAREVNNKNIKEVRSAYLIVREVELDEDFETYMPFNDVRITIPV